MDDIGFRGAGSRFNSRFEAGDEAALSKQLNDLAQGVQAGLPMPYIGEGQVVSFLAGGSQIYQTDNEMIKAGGSSYYNQFKCVVEESAAEGGGKLWTLQIVSGTMAYQNEHQADQISFTEVFDGSPVSIVPGEDPSSIFMNSDGYVVLDEGSDYGVYLMQIQSEDRKKFKSYFYIASTDDYEYPSGGFVAYGSDGTPPGIDLPFTGYTLQVLSIAFISWDTENEVFDVNQELIGSQTLPAPVRPSQFQVDVINQNPDPAGDPFWVLRVAKGTVLTPPEGSGECIQQELINEIDLGCDPVNGYQEITPWCNKAGYFGPIENDTDYDVWLFRVTVTADGVPSSIYKLWVGRSVDYTDACPVVLPSNIDPGGDYTAQAIYIGSATQPYSADVWLIDQAVQGTVTFPAYVANVCSPFKVKKYSAAEGSTDYEVCEGMVNNIIPSNLDELITVADGEETFVWVAIGTTGESPNVLFPDPENVTIENGASIPTDDDDYGYIGIAHIQTDGTVSQLVRGSVWASRIKIGTNTATYYYAGV